MKMLRKCSKFSSRLAVAICTVLGTVAGSYACDVPDGWTLMTGQKNEKGQAAIKLGIVPVPISSPFNIEVMICSDAIAKIERILIDAIMPAHRHGMNYRPDINQQDGGIYEANGMFFHMPGEWRIFVDAFGSENSYRFSLDVQAQ